ITELIRDVDGLFVRTRNRVNRIEPSGQSTELPERTGDPAGQIQLEDTSHAADENRLRRSGRDAQRPCQAVEGPFLLELPLAVEHLDATVLTIRDVQRAAPVDDDAVRRIELPRARAAIAPVLHQIAYPCELHDARVPIAVGHIGASVRTDSRVG